MEPIVEEKPPMDTEARIIETANYMSMMLDLDFSRCFKFAQQYSHLPKEEVVMLYLSK